MGFEIRLPLKLCHHPPVTLGHLAHAASRVIAFPDGNRVIELLPETAKLGLLRTGRRGLNVLQWPKDQIFPRGVEDGLLVGAVIEEKGIIYKPGPEVTAQKGENPVFRLDFAAQDAAVIRKTGESFEQMNFAVEVLNGTGHGKQNVVGTVPEKGGTILQEGRNEVKEVHFFLWQTGEKAMAEKESSVRGKGGDFPQNPAGMLWIGDDDAGIK